MQSQHSGCKVILLCVMQSDVFPLQALSSCERHQNLSFNIKKKQQLCENDQLEIRSLDIEKNSNL